MPHIIIETSRLLSDSAKFEQHFIALHNVFAQVDSSFDPRNCKSRVIIVDSYLSRIDPSSNFAHVSVKIFSGRDAKVKAFLLDLLSKFFIEIIAKTNIKTDFSIELTELNKEFYIKSSLPVATK